MKSNKLKDIFEWLSLIVVAFLIAFFMNNVILTNSYIPTPSMESNLPVGSRLFGFRLNYLFTEPKRGDVVIFDYGYTCKSCNQMYQKNDEEKCYFCGALDKKNKKAYFIKRIIGLPGEHIEIKAEYTADPAMFRELNFTNDDSNLTCGYVYINGEKYEEPYLNEPMLVNNFYRPIDVVVPENSYFLLGDNRNNSEDGRFWPNQFVDFKDIKAKAWFMYWPLYRMGIIK